MSRFKFPHVEEPSLRVKVMHYFMTIFCFFFAIFGFSIITCGAILTSGRPAECQFLGQFYTGVYLLLAAGCVTGFFSLLACLYVRRSSSPSDFISFSIVVIIVLVLQIFAAIAGHIFYTRASDGELKSSMNSTWEGYYDKEKDCVDRLQEKLECCGVSSYTEWLSLSVNANTAFPYPSSCLCASSSEKCTVRNETFGNSSHTVHVHSLSCHDEVLDSLHDTLLIPRVLGPVLSLVEFVVVLAVIYFLHHIDNHSMVGAYVVRPPIEDASAVSESSCSGRVGFQEGQSATSQERVVSQDSFSVSRDETIMHL